MKSASAAKKPAAKTTHTTAKKTTHTTHTTRSHTTAKKSTAKSASTTKKATIGGKCAWIAFGVRKPWYRRGAQELFRVAKRAGFVRGLPAAGGVVGLLYPDGYHAARVISTTGSWMTVDLWGSPHTLNVNRAQEAWVKE